MRVPLRANINLRINNRNATGVRAHAVGVGVKQITPSDTDEVGDRVLSTVIESDHMTSFKADGGKGSLVARWGVCIH